jgi:hypothetical protein
MSLGRPPPQSTNAVRLPASLALSTLAAGFAHEVAMSCRKQSTMTSNALTMVEATFSGLVPTVAVPVIELLVSVEAGVRDLYAPGASRADSQRQLLEVPFLASVAELHEQVALKIGVTHNQVLELFAVNVPPVLWPFCGEDVDGERMDVMHSSPKPAPVSRIRSMSGAAAAAAVAQTLGASPAVVVPVSRDPPTLRLPEVAPAPNPAVVGVASVQPLAAPEVPSVVVDVPPDDAADEEKLFVDSQHKVWTLSAQLGFHTDRLLVPARPGFVGLLPFAKMVLESRRTAQSTAADVVSRLPFRVQPWNKLVPGVMR